MFKQGDIPYLASVMAQWVNMLAPKLAEQSTWN